MNVSHPMRKNQQEVYTTNTSVNVKKDQDILFESNDVVVYDPSSSKGVLVSTYHSTGAKDSIEKQGIYSSRRAKELGLTDRNRPYLNDTIFFRVFPCKTIRQNLCYQIRVDPERTKVFDQEYHAKRGSTSYEPSMTLSRLLEIVGDKDLDKGYIYWNNFFSGNYFPYPRKEEHRQHENINSHFLYEVRVKMDNVPFSWFVKNEGGKYRRKASNNNASTQKQYTKTKDTYSGNDGIKRVLYTHNGNYYIIKMVQKSGSKQRKYVQVLKK
jgi:hypothetical protein